MTARLYPATRTLHVAALRVVAAVQLSAVGTPTALAPIALYVTRLILPDERQAQTCVARRLPGRCHDALNRPLRAMPVSTRAVTACPIRRAQRRGEAGQR